MMSHVAPALGGYLSCLTLGGHLSCLWQRWTPLCSFLRRGPKFVCWFVWGFFFAYSRGGNTSHTQAHLCIPNRRSASLCARNSHRPGAPLILWPIWRCSAQASPPSEVHLDSCGLYWQCLSCQFVGGDKGSHSLPMSEVHVCMCVCKYTYTYIYMYIYMRIHVCIYI